MQRINRENTKGYIKVLNENLNEIIYDKATNTLTINGIVDSDNKDVVNIIKKFLDFNMGRIGEFSFSENPLPGKQATQIQYQFKNFSHQSAKECYRWLKDSLHVPEEQSEIKEEDLKIELKKFFEEIEKNIAEIKTRKYG